MLVEPPGPLLPARAGLTIRPTDALRAAAGTAALVLALLSQGDAVVLAALVALAAWRPLTVVATLPALVAASWRWGSTSLEALAGAQAVLGPAGLVGPSRAAAASWLAAAALVLSAPAAARSTAGARVEPAGAPTGTRGRLVAASTRRPAGARLVAESAPDRAGARLVAASGPHRAGASLVVAPPARRPLGVGRVDPLAAVAVAAVGASAAIVVAGPAIGGDWWLRAVATPVAVAIAALAGRLRRGRETLVDGVAAVTGLTALALVSPDAPEWSGTLDGAALRSGALLAAAVGALAVVGSRAVLAMSQRRP